jgi:hypothetical protein
MVTPVSKLGFFSILSIVALFALANVWVSADAAPQGATPCLHTDFKTELIKQACAKGGQAEANAAMKAFMKEEKIKSCNQCHASLAPKYSLKANGLQQFQRAGGK